jgi:hypothetical protein
MTKPVAMHLHRLIRALRPGRQPAGPSELKKKYVELEWLPHNTSGSRNSWDGGGTHAAFLCKVRYLYMDARDAMPMRRGLL